MPITPAKTKAAQESADREARKEAEKALTRLHAEADSLKVARTKPTLGVLLDRWLREHEVDSTTRACGHEWVAAALSRPRHLQVLTVDLLPGAEFLG